MKSKKHLNLDDRIYIEKCLDNGVPIHQIATNLGKHDSSIAREIQRNRYKMPTKQLDVYYCRHRFSNCSVMHICDNIDCNRLCCNCSGFCHTEKCKDYVPEQCKRIVLIAIRNAILTDLMLFFADIAFPLSNNIKRKRVVSHETTLYFVAEHYNYL